MNRRIVETQFMAVDVDEVVAVFRSEVGTGSLQVFFKNGLRETVTYNKVEEMEVDYKKILSALKERDSI